MDFNNIIRQSELLIQWLDQRIDGLEVPANSRSRLSGGCLEVALEHQRAIVLLVAHKLYGSAFALSRVLFEAYVRGVWLRRCASEIDLQRFEDDRFEKMLHQLLSDIESLEGFEANVLSDIKRRSWHVMNSFTHTGFRQVIRRQTEVSIESTYGDEEVQEIIEFARAIGFLSAMEIALLVRSPCG
jgi:hypothetical protein